MFFAIIKVKLKASKKMFPDTQCTVRCKAGLFVEMPFPFLFLPTSGEWLMKMCENDGFSKLHKKAKCSPGGRSALDPLIHTRKNAERFSSGPWIGSQTITSRHRCKKVSLRTCRFAQVIVCDCWSAKNCGTYYCLPLRAKEKHAFNDAANKNGKSHALATYAGFWLKVTTFNAFHVWCRLKELNFKGGDMRILEIVKSICFRIRKDVFTEDLTCEFLIWVVSEFVTGNWEQLVKRDIISIFMFTVVFNFKHEYSLLCESVWVQCSGWFPLGLASFGSFLLSDFFNQDSIYHTVFGR